MTLPPNARAAALTDAYRTRLGALRDNAALTMVGLLKGIDLSRPRRVLTASMDEWGTTARATTHTASLAAMTLSAGYTTAYVREAGIRPEPPPPTFEPDVSIAGRAGWALLWKFNRTHSMDAALAYAVSMAERDIRTAVNKNSREYMREAMTAEPSIEGWRRATAKNTCARCAAGVGQVFLDRDDLDAHPACRCTPEPVIIGADKLQRQPPSVIMS